MNNTIQLERNTVLKLTASTAAKVWLLKAGQQDTLHASLAAAEELILGPYLNITQFRIESADPVTIANQAPDFSTPVEPSDYNPVAAAVADAVDETDIVDQFNALLASMRVAGQLEESE